VKKPCRSLSGLGLESLPASGIFERSYITVLLRTQAFQDDSLAALPTVETDAAGLASTIVIVRHAGTFQVFAIIAGTETWVAFELTGSPAPATQLLINSGNNRPGATPVLSVRVTDGFGNGIAGIPLRVDVVTGGGFVSATLQADLTSAAGRSPRSMRQAVCRTSWAKCQSRTPAAPARLTVTGASRSSTES
jgi:hypothetical protein